MLPTQTLTTRALQSIKACLAVLAFSAISVISATNAFAQTPTPADFARQIDELLTAQYKPTDPGAVVLLTKNGETLLRKAYGMADTEKGAALQPKDLFRVGSITKSFTAIAIMLLQEDGKLAVTDDITRFLPYYPTQGRKITIEHLLTHTSGIANYTDMPEFRKFTKANSITDVINLIGNAPMPSAPGEQYAYSNSGYFLLGAIIEKASNMPYADFLTARVFKPLGMEQTGVEQQDRSGLAAKLVSGYRTQGGQFMLAPPLNGGAFAAGAMVSTADDLLRWQQAVLAEKLLKPSSWKRVFTPAQLSNGSPAEYGYGMVLRKLRGQTMREHSGVISGFQAMALVLPQEQLTLGKH